MTNWRLIILSTAEEPLLSDDSHDGMNTRVMEIHGVPIENKREGAEFHHVSEQNYGFAGKKFIKQLCAELKKNNKKIEQDFEIVRSEINKRVDFATHLENASVIALGDYYSDMWIWGADEKTALENAVETAVAMLNNNMSLAKEDIISRAWQYVNEWCVSNDKAFGADAPVQYGFREDINKYYVLKFALDDALKRKNYPVEKCMTGFYERGYMQMHGNRRQIQKRHNGTLNRYYLIEVQGCEDALKPLDGDK